MNEILTPIELSLRRVVEMTNGLANYQRTEIAEVFRDIRSQVEAQKAIIADQIKVLSVCTIEINRLNAQVEALTKKLKENQDG